MEPKVTMFGKFLAVYEILGGIVGLWLLGASVFGTGQPEPAGIILLGLPVVSLAAGILLFMGKPLGQGLSSLTQALQVPHLMVKGFYYFGFLLGSFAIVRDSRGEFLLRWFAGSGARLLTGEIPFQMVGVNLLALVLLLLVPRALIKPV